MNQSRHLLALFELEIQPFYFFVKVVYSLSKQRAPCLSSLWRKRIVLSIFQLSNFYVTCSRSDKMQTIFVLGHFAVRRRAQSTKHKPKQYAK